MVAVGFGCVRGWWCRGGGSGGEMSALWGVRLRVVGRVAHHRNPETATPSSQ